MAEQAEGDERYDALVKEHRNIEESLRKITALQRREGLLTDWIILSSVQSFDREGNATTNVGWCTNPEGGIPYHRMLGLIEYAKTMLQQEVLEDEG